jgi:hypothetical protein
MGKSIAELLAESGLSIEEASKAVRALRREKAEERVELLEREKGNNRDKVVTLANEIRDSLEQAGSELLPGSHLNFTVRVTEKGVIATANECHATGFVESIHVTPSGDTVTGKEGAELAKNVRPRKKNDD